MVHMIYSVHRNMVSADMVYIEIDTCNHKHGLHDISVHRNMVSADMVCIEIDTCNHKHGLHDIQCPP